MKAKFILSFIIALFLNIAFFSCTKDELVPALKGSLVGYVYTFDEFAILKDDHSNVQVSALGLDHFSTRTDKNGRFEFKDLPAGTYELSLEKEGFGTLKQFGIQHLGGQPTILGLRLDGSANNQAFFIYQMPTTEIISLSVQKDTLTGVFSFAGYRPGYVPLRVYCSNVKDFDISDAQLVTGPYVSLINEEYKGRIYDLETKFLPGDEVFFKACILYNRGGITDFVNRIVIGIDSYFDYSTNTTIYPNLGDESAQYSFIYQE
jgi:hypothetical protein